MKTSKIIMAIAYLFVTGPIWFYLLYKILVLVNATELMFFLYWVYLPVSLLMGTIAKLSDGD